MQNTDATAMHARAALPRPTRLAPPIGQLSRARFLPALRGIGSAGMMLACAGLLMLSTSSESHAAPQPPSPQLQDADDDLQAEIRRMREEMARLRDENQQMRGEIDDLKLATQDNWLSEQRAEEIRQMVTDVLADAESRAGYQTSGLTAGWIDGFFLNSPDGRFRLELQGLTQVRFIQNFREQNDRSRGGFEVPRARLTFKGHIFDRDWTYLTRLDVTRREPGLVQNISFISDAWIRRQVTDKFAIRAGQFKLPFGREELVSSSSQLAVERSLVSETLSLRRSQGVELSWMEDHWRVALMVSDGAANQIINFVPSGLPAGTAPNMILNADALRQAAEWAFTSRAEFLLAGTWRQFEDFTSPMDDPFGLLLGIAGHVQKDESTGAASVGRNENRYYYYTVDASAEFGGANLFGSFTHFYIDTVAGLPELHVFGAVVQAGVYLTPKLEVFTRYEWGRFDWDDVVDRKDLHLLTLGFNYYFEGHDLKWTTDIGFGLSQIEDIWATASSITGWRSETVDRRAQIVIRTQFQLTF